jgi:ribosomal protein L6P/L9E
VEAGSIPACAFAKMSQKQIVWTYPLGEFDPTNYPGFFLNFSRSEKKEEKGGDASVFSPSAQGADFGVFLLAQEAKKNQKPLNTKTGSSSNKQIPLIIRKSLCNSCFLKHSNNNNLLQKLEILCPLGMQYILIPSSIDLNISVSFTSPKKQDSEGTENSWIQTIIIDIFFAPETKQKANLNKKTGVLGTLRAQVLQMLVGVTYGFTCNINLIGVGYKGHFIPAFSCPEGFAKANREKGGKTQYGQLSLSLGFGHSVIVPLSSNLHIDPLKIVNSSQGSVIPVSSNSLSELNNFAYSISKLRPAHKSFKGTGVSISKA